MKENLRRLEKLLAMVFAGILLAVAAGGYGYYVKQRGLIEQSAGEQLGAIADLKQSQIARWLEEYKSDARWILDSQPVVAAALSCLAEPATHEGPMLSMMNAWKTHNRYGRVILLDSSLEVRLSAPQNQSRVSSTAANYAAATLLTNNILVSDLHLDEFSQRVCMDIFVPLWPTDVETTFHAKPPGVFMFEIDPREFLFPHLQTWPTPSATAETLLVRREGNDVMYLNELRHQTNTAMKLRFPIAPGLNLPAIWAVLGEEKTANGVDYRGVPVLAATRKIPNSNWFIVAKQDQSEILTPLTRLVWAVGIIAGLLILAAGLGIVYVWRSREFEFTRNELEVQRHNKTVQERLMSELERKNEELEHVIYAASHDLRSPLVNIEGFGKRLEKSCRMLAESIAGLPLPDDRRETIATLTDSQIPKALGYIRLGAAKMNALIGGLLQLSRLGHVPLRTELLDMNRLLKDVVAAQAYQLQNANALVEIDPLPSCEGDAQHINQVFSNLVDNALKYRDKNLPLRIRISGYEENEESVYCVTDNGIGIAPADQKKIWELFHRLDPLGPVTGDGLGLNLVRRILDRHHGRAWVKSMPGQGSRFFVSLPKRTSA